MMNLSRKHIWENKEEIGMNQVVITIARQYGSGGRTVGKMLAERLGISFYDKQNSFQTKIFSTIRQKWSMILQKKNPM